MAGASDALRLGRRALEDVPGLSWIADLEWDGDVGAWFFHVELQVEVPAGSPVPERTQWIVRVDPEYPGGPIDVLPATSGGIERTFHHQLNNWWSDPGKPWRNGKICLDTGTAALDRHVNDGLEPRSAEERLFWHLSRALRWLRAASRRELTLPGDPFEIPDYAAKAPPIAFAEDTISFAQWADTDCAFGLVDLVQAGGRSTAARRFLTGHRKAVLEPRWGARITAASAPPTLGAWLRVPAVVVEEPWHSPMTWGALRECLGRQGVDLMGALSRVAPALRDGIRHPLLLGFPIPEVVGGSPVRLHWIALQLPPLSGIGRVPGFRDRESSHWLHDSRTLFPDGRELEWVETEAWSDDELTRRGRLVDAWTTARTLILGAGALGSAVAELLVRGGAREVGICDPEVLEGGNLVRHVLTLDGIGLNKAAALSDRLNGASPHARVRGIPSAFPPNAVDDVAWCENANCVVDCTANDDVLRHLEKFAWRGRPAVFHLSLGRDARRLFLFGRGRGAISAAEYLEWVNPWLVAERAQFGEAPLLRPWTGCWHPAFSARPDQIWLFAAAAVAWMNQWASRPTFDARTVLERGEHAFAPTLRAVEAPS